MQSASLDRMWYAPNLLENIHCLILLRPLTRGHADSVIHLYTSQKALFIPLENVLVLVSWASIVFWFVKLLTYSLLGFPLKRKLPPEF